jgi:hypothetical protein
MHLYCVTYKSTLKHGKNLNDFRKWLKSFWEIQQTWGAESVYYWSEKQGEDHLVFCQYMVIDVRRWNRRAIQQGSSILVRELEGIVETNRITVHRIFAFDKTNPNN